MSISQTEKAVEREQIRSNEQILPTPALNRSKLFWKVLLKIIRTEIKLNLKFVLIFPIVDIIIHLNFIFKYRELIFQNGKFSERIKNFF
jgi:hypothetical protein